VRSSSRLRLRVPRRTTGDFNGDSKPDYVLYNVGTHQTAIWYLNNNVYVGGGFGPTLPNGWAVVGAADFDRDGHPDFALFNSSTRQTAIWYLSGRTFLRSAFGPTVPGGWALVATADFNSDGHPDFCFTIRPVARQQSGIWITTFTSAPRMAQLFRLAGAWSRLS
jgi:VCBS repeat protein